MNSIQGNGSTLHVVGECVNRIGKEYSSSFLKEGQLGAIAWIEHPNGGIIDIQFSPFDGNQKQLFRNIIKSIRLLE